MVFHGMLFVAALSGVLVTCVAPLIRAFLELVPAKQTGVGLNVIEQGDHRASCVGLGDSRIVREAIRKLFRF